MSSYVESPYRIEERRLAGIVAQCEQEVRDAMQKYETEKQQLRQSKAQAMQIIEAGKQWQTQESVKKVDRDEKAEELWEKSSNLLEQEQKIRLEKQIQEDVKEDVEIFTSGREKGKKGMLLKTARKEKTDAAKIQEDICSFFVEKLQVAKQAADVETQKKLDEIEQRFLDQPDFGKELYAQQNLSVIETILQEEKNRRETEERLDEEKEQTVIRYMALKSVCHEKIENETELGKIPITVLKRQCEKLWEKKQDEKQRQYVLRAVATVMKRHNISFYDEKSGSTSFTGCQYDENTEFDVRGLSQQQFIVEVKGRCEGKTPTWTERKRSAASARKICRLFETIREELKQEYGIIFGQLESTEPSEASMKMVCKDRSGEVNSRQYVTKKTMSSEQNSQD